MGLTANYKGFFCVARAVYHAAGNPQRLLLVTKWLYPKVADDYGTTWQAVERNIRTVVDVVWESNSEALSEMAGYRLEQKPTSAQFISILVSALHSHTAA